MKSFDVEQSNLWINQTSGPDRLYKRVSVGRRKKAKQGEQNPQAKLTSALVREIRYRYITEPVTFCDLSKQYCVLPSTISDLIARRTWKHISDLPTTIKEKPKKIPIYNRGAFALSEQQVCELRKRYQIEKISLLKLGKEYGITRKMAGYVVNRKRRQEVI